LCFILGSFNGGLASLPAHELGAIVIKESVNRSKIKVEDVDEVILGHILTAGMLHFTAYTESALEVEYVSRLIILFLSF